MTLVDTNLLIYATFVDTPEHERAHAWLVSRLAEGGGTVAFCWPVVYAFLRLITSTRVFGPQAVTVRDGWAVAPAYLEQPAVRLVTPGAATQRSRRSSPRLQVSAATTCQTSRLPRLQSRDGLVLASHDHGFRRFSGLSVLDPPTPDADIG